MSFNSSEYTHSTGGGKSKILTPGEHYCRIIDITLTVPSFKPEGFFLNLLLEGPHMGDDFEGIDVDKTNPAAGKYAGKIATVNANRYPFSTFEYQGRTIDRDEQIFNWLNGLATQLDVFTDIQKAGIKAETIEAYLEAVKPFLINPELWGTYTIAGREYYKDGYDSPNYNLFLPKKSGKDYPYTALINEAKEPVLNLLRYNEAEHIIKADKPTAPTTVDTFGENAVSPSGGGIELP
jgi:hypothetical protein